MRKPEIAQLDELLAAVVAADLSEAELAVGELHVTAQRTSTGRVWEGAVRIAEPTSEQDSHHEIRAPMVGYFRAPDPPLAVGDPVTVGTLIGSIVSLGLANEVRSDREGILTEYVVADGQAVEYGELLARIRPKKEVTQ